MVEINHEDIDVFQYDINNTDIINNLAVFVNNSNKKYVLVVSNEVTLYPNSFNGLDLSNYDDDVIELKNVDKDTGVVQYGTNLTGAARLRKLFPTVKDQECNEVTPQYPKIALYNKEVLKNHLKSIPLTVRKLNTGLAYLLDAVMSCDFKNLLKVSGINDKVYGEYSKINRKKVFVSESLLYIDKILFNLGIKSDYYASFVYWSKEEIKNAL